MSAVKHSKVSAKADGTDSTLVRPSDWDADHAVTWGSSSDIASESFGAVAAAGASGKVADAAHRHSMPELLTVGWGTAFPSEKAIGDQFWRTDLGLEFYWDGAQWLSVTLFREPPSSTVFPLRWASWGSAFGLWLVALDVETAISSRNSHMSYYTLSLAKYTRSDVGAVLLSFTTRDDLVSSRSLYPPFTVSLRWTSHRAVIGAVLEKTTYAYVGLAATPYGSPGTLNWTAALEYRVIGA